MSIDPEDMGALQAIRQEFVELVEAELVSMGFGDCRVPRTEVGLTIMQDAMAKASDKFLSPAYEITVDPVTPEQRRLRMSPTVTLRYRTSQAVTA